MLQEEDKALLNQYVTVLSRLSDLVPADYGVTISDCTTCLFYKPARSLDLKAPVGEPLREGSAIKRAVKKTDIYQNRQGGKRSTLYCFGQSLV